MTQATLDAAVLFAHEAIHDGWCCDCCDGYCPGEDEKRARWDSLWSLVIDDVEYVTDRYLLLPMSRLSGLPDEEVIPIGGSSQRQLRDMLWPVPTEPPEVSTSLQSVDNADRLDRAGLTVRGATPKVQHLYLGEEWVGWTTVATKGISGPSELKQIRAMANAIGVDLKRAHRALRIAHGEEAS